MMALVRVVTPQPSGSGLVGTQGTKLMVGDTELTGVTKVVLTAEVNDVWRAEVQMHVQPPADLAALSIVHYPTHWQRVKNWLRRLYRN